MDTPRCNILRHLAGIGEVIVLIAEKKPKLRVFRSNRYSAEELEALEL